MVQTEVEMEQPRIENLILANHVEAVNGLLYIAGGGWTDHWRPAAGSPAQPVVSHLGVGVTVAVPWTASGNLCPLSVSIEDSVGNQIAGMVTQLNTSRPAGLPTGADLRTVLALSMNVVFPKPGEYRVAATLAGQPTRVVDFRVHDVAPPPVPPPEVN
ncbi:MAG TPA: hypothetical protein VNF24_09275 [Candidatus Acidoferrales bacterium]|nr:hypothetical protein [Candidatus Acidoferrales bacterium]HVC38793.1 hypothetical protein [Candidatus Dormibacteraeota bacterium]